MLLAAFFPFPVPRRVWSTDVHHRPGTYFGATASINPGTHWLQLVLAGQQVIRVRGVTCEVRRGDLCLFLRNEQVEYIATSRMLRTLSIFFEPSPKDRFFRIAGRTLPTQEKGLHLPWHLGGAKAAELHEFFHLMHRLCLHREALPRAATLRLLDWQISALLNQILLALASSFSPASSRSAGSPAIRRVLRLMTRHPERPHSAEDLAACAELPIPTLNRQFRKVTGWSIKQYHQHLRVQQARQILKDEPAIPLSDLAPRLGFYDAFHLSKTFKQQTGLTPTEYRSQILTSA